MQSTSSTDLAHGAPRGEELRPRATLHDRVAGLDTLRAVAVLAVLGYHAAVPHLGGGFLGVTLFFVISGYLITRLLLAEMETRGTVNLVGFWIRRFRRLFPAAMAMILACLCYAVLFAPDLLTKLRGDSIAGMFYVSNWWMLLREVSYFDSFGLPSPLAHLWTLAIEEQFYVIWPVALVALVVFVRSKRTIMWVMGAAIGASVATMALTYDASGDPSRSYLATDVRVGELLLGAVLALALHLTASKQVGGPQGWASAVVHGRSGPLLLVVSATALGLLVATLPENSAFTYRGGIVLGALASAGLVLSCQSVVLARVAAWCDRSLIGAIGRRSYSIYLWHFPVLVAVSTPVDFGRFSAARAGAALALTVVLAEISYRVVETPFRRLGIGRTLRDTASRVHSLSRGPRNIVIAAAVLPVLLPGMALAGVRSPTPKDQSATTSVVEGAQPAGANTQPHRDARRKSQPETQPEIETETEVGTAAGSQPGQRPEAQPAAQPRPKPARPGAGPRKLTGKDTVLVGDSVMIKVAPKLRARMPGLTVNAEVGRQPGDGLKLAKTYRQFDRPGGNYILGLGTNGAYSATSLREFCAQRKQARIFLITPRVSRPWESASVSAIRQAARSCPNVRVVDFHSAARNHPDYFVTDGVHLTPSGTQRMVELILAAARQ